MTDVVRRDELAALSSRHGPGLVVVGGASGSGRTTLVRAYADGFDGDVRWAVGQEWESGRAGGILDQVGELSAGPLLVVVDDADWADLPSLQALASWVRHEDGRVVAVCGSRTSNLELLHRVSTLHLELDALTAGPVARLAAARGLSLAPTMCERLVAHTRGNLGAIDALLVEVDPAVWGRFDPALPAPASVVVRVREGLNSCAPGARRVAEAAAVLGPQARTADLAVLAGLSDDLLPALDEAAARGLVAVSGRDLTHAGPADPMVAAAILDEMGPAAAASARYRAAQAIDDPVAQVRHLAAAAPMPERELADRLEAVAAECSARGEWSAAASLLRDASRLSVDRELRDVRLTRSVDALIGAGDVFGAVALVPEVESIRETPMRNAVLGYLAIIRGRTAEAGSRLRRAWDLVDSQREPDVAALICQRKVLHALCSCRPDDLVAWADRALALVGPDEPAGVEAAAIRGLGVAYDDPVTARRAYETLTQRVTSGAQVQRIALGRGWSGVAAGDFDAARSDLESAVPTANFGGSTRISLWASGWLARLHFLTGDWDEALRVADDATVVVDRTGIVVAGPLLRWTQVAVRAARGDFAGAESALRHAESVPQDYDIMRGPAAIARAHLAEARNDAAGVLRALRPLLGAGSRIDDQAQWPWLDMYALALSAIGETSAAADALAAISASGAARARLAAAHGQVAAARGDLEGARIAFAEAFELLDAAPLRFDRARIGLGYGQVLRRAGKRREAEAELSSARDAFATLRAATYVARCDRELQAGGVGIERVERSATGLTPQEHAVATLVARGMANREVAAELFVSDKTVQYHLTRIYAKLGIRSRAELAAMREFS